MGLLEKEVERGRKGANASHGAKDKNGGAGYLDCSWSLSTVDVSNTHVVTYVVVMPSHFSWTAFDGF